MLHQFLANCKGSNVYLTTYMFIWVTLVTSSCRLHVFYTKIKNKTIHTCTQLETGTHTTTSSSAFSLQCDVKLPFIFRPQRLTRFHDVAALLSLICICCPLHPSISIRVVLAHSCELDCVIWFGAEQEHLFYKTSAPSIPQASWKKQTMPAVGLLVQHRTSKPELQPRVPTLSWIILSMREERWEVFAMESSKGWSYLVFIVWLTVVENVFY